MTDDIIDRARRMQESVNAINAGAQVQTGLGKAVGVVMVRAIENAYTNGRADARVEIEKAISDLPIRTRQGVELIERGATLRIIHDLDSE